MPELEALARENSQDELQEKYLKVHDETREGSLINGTVIQVDNDYVYLNVGLKSEGRIPKDEFSELPKPNDIVEVVLVKREGNNGEVVISKQKAEHKVLWNTLRHAVEFNEPVTGKVVKIIKGGFDVDLGCGVTAFCPISKINIQHIDTPEEYLNQEYSFLIDKLYNNKKINIVLTRRQWLEQEMESKRDKFFETAIVGDEVEGIVKSFTSFGVFIDLGGFDGLLHVNDMSWGHVKRPREYVKKGDKIKLKLIRLDHELKKINLSLKHLQPDPWLHFEDKYHVDQIIKGRVTKLTDFGAFIEIEEGVEGLAHISEFSWVKRVKHPKEIFQIGDECEAMILGYDISKERISLGLKQVLPNPWTSIDQRYPVGTRGTWIIKKITNAGAFIELEEGIDAFLHADEYSWTKKIRNLSTVLKENEPIEAVVISVNPEDRRIRLGIKQLMEDPWSTFPGRHPRGSIIKGTISGKTDFGVFVNVGDNIEGLIHKNNLPATQDENADEKLNSLNVGDSIEAAVVDINITQKKLSLSVKELKHSQEQAELSKYMDGSSDAGESYTLADMIKDKQD